MPLLRNPSGVLVVVPERLANEMLEELPQRVNTLGKVVKPGFRPATPAEHEEYAALVRKAAEDIAAREAADLERREAASFAVAKGLLKHIQGQGKK